MIKFTLAILMSTVCFSSLRAMESDNEQKTSQSRGIAIEFDNPPEDPQREVMPIDKVTDQVMAKIFFHHIEDASNLKEAIERMGKLRLVLKKWYRVFEKAYSRDIYKFLLRGPVEYPSLPLLIHLYPDEMNDYMNDCLNTSIDSPYHQENLTKYTHQKLFENAPEFSIWDLLGKLDKKHEALKNRLENMDVKKREELKKYAHKKLFEEQPSFSTWGLLLKLEEKRQKLKNMEIKEGFKGISFGGLRLVKWANGNMYEGGFTKDKPNKKGLFRYPNGDTYEGDFGNGKRQGKGTFTWRAGATYEGDFKNGKRHGKGTFKDKAGTIYEGDFENSKRHGNGKLWTKYGNTYEGTFEDDNPSGEGAHTFKNGNTLHITKKNDKLRVTFHQSKNDSSYEGDGQYRWDTRDFIFIPDASSGKRYKISLSSGKITELKK